MLWVWYRPSLLSDWISLDEIRSPAQIHMRTSSLAHTSTRAPARTRTRMRTLTAFPCACGHVRRYNAFGKSGGEYPPEAGADACWESQRAMQRGKTKTSMGVRASGEH